jgi:hypothetical protein
MIPLSLAQFGGPGRVAGDQGRAKLSRNSHRRIAAIMARLNAVRFARV